MMQLYHVTPSASRNCNAMILQEKFFSGVNCSADRGASTRVKRFRKRGARYGSAVEPNVLSAWQRPGHQ